jgi:hypothetical protein
VAGVCGAAAELAGLAKLLRILCLLPVDHRIAVEVAECSCVNEMCGVPKR